MKTRIQNQAIQTIATPAASTRRNVLLARRAGCAKTAIALTALLVASTPQTTAQAKSKAPATPVVQVENRQGNTVRVVVKAFDAPEAQIANWRAVGGEIADMMITELVNNGVDVIERRTLADQEREGELGLDGTTSQSSTAELGQKLGGQVMMVGRVTEFGYSEKTSTGGAILGSILGGGGQSRKKSARVKIDGRLVDVRTGRILAAKSVEAWEAKGGFTIGGLFGAAGLFDTRSSEWTQSMIGKATRKAVNDFVAQITPLIPSADDRRFQGGQDGNTVTPSIQTSSFETLGGMAALRKLTCVVLIPETHLTHPRIPDPAAETEITRLLLAAGVRVKDDARLRELREERWVREAATGKPNAAKLAELRARFGADILITGEGITERVAQEQVDRASVICRGRVEVKAIRMDTGEIIAAEAAHAPGRDLSEALSSKSALQTAGGQVGSKLIVSMAQNLANAQGGNPGAGAVTMEVEIAGFANLKEANAFLTALGQLPAIQNADLQDWKGGVLFASLKVDPNAARKVGLMLETNDKLAKFNVEVSDSNAAKVMGRVKKG